MTRDEILAMEPGEELDRATAEYVLGRPFQKPGHEPCCTCQVCGHGFDECLCGLSEDIAAAWEVVEKIDAGSYRWRLASKHCRSGHVWWTATLDKYLGAVNGWKEMVYAPGDTAPEAICKAALLAVMEN